MSSLPSLPGTDWAQVDYSAKEGLTKTLRGVHTVMSFITPQTDPGSDAQKNLIDASISAGVKRFAPSEWATYVYAFQGLLSLAHLGIADPASSI